MQEPRRIAIHRSLNRPHLLLGAERSLVLVVGLITALVIFSGDISTVSIVVGVSFWSGSFWALIRMGKADSQMSRVYQRHIRYRPYYSARSCIDAPLPHAAQPKG
jgi:type IV secretion system protein TrbD